MHMKIYRVFAVSIGLALGVAAVSDALAGGLPEIEPSVVEANGSRYYVQSSDALSEAHYTAGGRFAASSGNVVPGIVTLHPEATWLPNVVLDVNQPRRARPGFRRIR